MLPSLTTSLSHRDKRWLVDQREILKRNNIHADKHRRQRQAFQRSFVHVSPRYHEALLQSPDALDGAAGDDEHGRGFGALRQSQHIVDGDARRLLGMEEVHVRLQLPRQVMEEHSAFLSVSDKLLPNKKKFVVLDSVPKRRETPQSPKSNTARQRRAPLIQSEAPLPVPPQTPPEGSGRPIRSREQRRADAKKHSKAVREANSKSPAKPAQEQKLRRPSRRLSVVPEKPSVPELGGTAIAISESGAHLVKPDRSRSISDEGGATMSASVPK